LPGGGRSLCSSSSPRLTGEIDFYFAAVADRNLRIERLPDKKVVVISLLEPQTGFLFAEDIRTGWFGRTAMRAAHRAEGNRPQAVMAIGQFSSLCTH
jgi:hypothetical protein